MPSPVSLASGDGFFCADIRCAARHACTGNGSHRHRASITITVQSTISPANIRPNGPAKTLNVYRITELRHHATLRSDVSLVRLTTGEFCHRQPCAGSGSRTVTASSSRRGATTATARDRPIADGTTSSSRHHHVERGQRHDDGRAPHRRRSSQREDNPRQADGTAGTAHRERRAGVRRQGRGH